MSGPVLQVCAGSGCLAAGADRVAEALRRALEREGIDRPVEEVSGRDHGGVGITGCMGPCGSGPLVRVPDMDLLYCRVREEDASEIVERTVRGGQVIQRLRGPETGTPFFGPQVRQALRRCGSIDPECIDDYLERGGYEGLARAVRTMSPAQVIDAIKRSGLQGRGGAGFPTGMKWELVAAARDERKFVVCNGDEGDPGAFTDRSLMEGDPHALIEGIAIAGYAVGAQAGFLYTRAEYTLTVRRLRAALEQARRRGFVGPRVAGSRFDFDLSLVEAAGAFVCGEETALLNSIEGRRGMPAPRPPYPASRGLWGRPTLINNVETMANVATILAPGADGLGAVGTPLSKGTKVFSLTGSVKHVGLIEVPMGISLREIVFDIGGGIPGGRKFKAALIGGPSGSFIPASLADTRIDFESLRKLGATLGSGGLVILDDAVCMVDAARHLMQFCVEESCGKCPSCRIGTRVMLNLLERTGRDSRDLEDIQRVSILGDHVRRTSLCGLGQNAPNPTLSAIRYFREEFDAHLRDGRCTAGACSG